MSIRSRVGGWFLRSDPTISLDQWASYFDYGGLSYPFMPTTMMGGDKSEEPPATFEGYVQAGYRSNGVIFACMLARMAVFSEARFQFRQIRNGRPGDLFGTPSLGLLEKPWTNGTTGDLLSRMIQDADTAGNFYAARRSATAIRRMRPDWVTIVLGSDQPPDTSEAQLDAEVIGYIYHPGGKTSSYEPIPLLPEEVAHFAPIPDPAARYRGMSWLTPIIRELMADQAMTTHKLKFFENGATINQAVTLDPSVRSEAFDAWVAKFRAHHEGLEQAYKTLFLGGGATITQVGADLAQATFKVVQGHGETRIAAAAGTPPVIVGLSEGLEAATYSNYAQARRRFTDGTIRPLWRNAAGSLSTIIDVPRDAELWYDDRDIPFLQEDIKDAAEHQQRQAISIKTLVDAGYEADSVTDAIVSGDLKRLKHSGLFSVQLQKPGDGAADAKADANADANADLPEPTDNGGKPADVPAGKQ